MEQLITLIIACGILAYLAIGMVFGCKEICVIIRDARKEGLNATSRKTLELEYGGDYGSTPISLFIFPFFFMVAIWPLTLICDPSGQDG